MRVYIFHPKQPPLSCSTQWTCFISLSCLVYCFYQMSFLKVYTRDCLWGLFTLWLLFQLQHERWVAYFPVTGSPLPFFFISFPYWTKLESQLTQRITMSTREAQTRGKSATTGLNSWYLYWLITKLIAHVGNLNFLYSMKYGAIKLNWWNILKSSLNMVYGIAILNDKKEIAEETGKKIKQKEEWMPCCTNYKQMRDCGRGAQERKT